MRALSGCIRCGHVERVQTAKGQPPRSCPECGFPMRDVDLLAARILSRGRRRNAGLQERVRSELASRGRMRA
jgi:hypothetical protein